MLLAFFTRVMSLSTALTPCAGKCSTVFGDSVCRGCRRFSHEVIDWNKYTPEQQKAIWLRLDIQLDQILLPLVGVQDWQLLLSFLNGQQERLTSHASKGRHIYHALRLCQRQPRLLEHSGLGMTAEQMETVWQLFEQRVYSLAVASFEMAWLRAAQFSNFMLNEAE